MHAISLNRTRDAEQLHSLTIIPLSYYKGTPSFPSNITRQIPSFPSNSTGEYPTLRSTRKLIGGRTFA